MNQINIMDFENNPINNTINKKLDDYIEMYTDDSKPLINFDYNFAGTIVPITLFDKWLIHKTLELKDEKQIEKRIEYLIEIVKNITKGERMKLIETLIDSIDDEDFTSFQKSRLYKLAKPN